MLLAFAITPQLIRLFKLEEVVGTVVIKDIPAPLKNFLAVFVKLCLDEVIFFGEYGKGAVYVVQLKRWFF